ncbi:MAG: glycosyltransferase [Solirubrobacteraceae bacterium]|nr:glycosyltransferase [Solirubrobacteraceae bacterium]
MSLNVLFVTNLWPDEARPWHGPFVRRQADSLVEAGVALDALVIRGWDDRSAYPKAARRIARLNRACRYDVVHAHYGHAAIVARLQLRAPLVVTYWGSDLLGKRAPSGAVAPHSRLEAATFRQLARITAATITQSLEMEQALPASAQRRNHVLPAGIELERFRPLDRDEARARLGWEADERVVLFAANPELPVKNHPLAVAAVERLRAHVPDARLEVAWGRPPDEMPLLMNAADALLLPSRSEGSPNVVKEALAAELPVVATRVGDVEQLLAGLPGCHACPSDADALAHGLRDALAHGRVPEGRLAMAPLDIGAVAQRTIAIYEDVIRAARLRRRRRAGASHSPQRDGS